MDPELILLGIGFFGLVIVVYGIVVWRAILRG